MISRNAAAEVIEEPTSIDRQVIALLTGHASAFVGECTGKVSLDSSDYADVFTVSRTDIREYVRKNGFPSGAFCGEPQSFDGIYMIESEGDYRIYFQERGVKFNESVFSSKEKVESELIDRLIAHSGAESHVPPDSQMKSGARLKQLLSRVFGRNRTAP